MEGQVKFAVGSGGPLLGLVSRTTPISSSRGQQYGKLFFTSPTLERVPRSAKLRADALVPLKWLIVV
jgi:hypothetical protein